MAADGGDAHLFGPERALLLEWLANAAVPALRPPDDDICGWWWNE